jgi:hypothetical protein
MPRVTILCHSKEELGFYIYIYDNSIHPFFPFVIWSAKKTSISLN